MFYLNGITTSAQISDHKLKRLLVENGGRISIHLGRKEVTHVILGRASNRTRSGLEGTLAATKRQKEIRRRGSSVKYVAVEG